MLWCLSSPRQGLLFQNSHFSIAGVVLQEIAPGISGKVELRRSKSGNFEKPCSTLSFLDQNLSHLRTGDAKGFPGIPKGSQRVPKGSQRILPKKSQKSSETLYIYVSCDVEFYRVLLDFKINLDRTGTLRFTLFWAFLGRLLQPALPAGWRIGARLGPARKVPKNPSNGALLFERD